MKRLPLKKRINNLHYTQVKRTDKIALYALRIKPKDSITGYELLIISIQQPRINIMPDGRKIESPLRECFQSSESLGNYAWSIAGKEKALEQFDLLEQLINSHKSEIPTPHMIREVLEYA